MLFSSLEHWFAFSSPQLTELTLYAVVRNPASGSMFAHSLTALDLISILLKTTSRASRPTLATTAMTAFVTMSTSALEEQTAPHSNGETNCS